MAQMLKRIQSLFQKSLASNFNARQPISTRQGWVVFSMSLIVHSLKVVTFILGPVAFVVIAFGYVGKWLGFFGSVVVSGGWGVAVASLMFIVLFFLGRYLDRKMDEIDGNTHLG